jgi:uncharacterized membrane protein YczE
VLPLLPSPDHVVWRLLFLAVGLVTTGIGSGLYIGAGLGSGPRDGIMMGLSQRGVSVRVARTALEVTVVALGFALGGRVGIGTLAFALCIGPLVHLFLPRLTFRRGSARHVHVPLTGPLRSPRADVNDVFRLTAFDVPHCGHGCRSAGCSSSPLPTTR